MTNETTDEKVSSTTIEEPISTDRLSTDDLNKEDQQELVEEKTPEDISSNDAKIETLVTKKKDYKKVAIRGACKLKILIL